MLDLRSNPIATARVPIKGEYRRVTGRVVAQTFERDPVLDIRLDDGAVVQVRKSEASVVADRAQSPEPIPSAEVTTS